MNRTQLDKLPKVFRDKIKIDRGVDTLKKRKVINFDHGKSLILKQQTFRYRCIEFLKQKGSGRIA